jgi:hypothetical protein
LYKINICAHIQFGIVYIIRDNWNKECSTLELLLYILMWSMFWIWRHFVTIDSCIIVLLSILHMWAIWTCAIMDNTIELLEWKWYQCTQISHYYISDCTFVKSDLGEYAFKFWQEDVLVWLNLFFLTWTVTS